VAASAEVIFELIPDLSYQRQWDGNDKWMGRHRGLAAFGDLGTTHSISAE
jgi:hypothetical protein